MHSFDNPNPPPEMMHPVVSYVATKVGAALGGSAASVAAAEKQAWDQGFKRVDPAGRTLDVTNEVPFDRRGKMYWIIGRLEGTYPFATTRLSDFPVAARDPGNVLERDCPRKRRNLHSPCRQKRNHTPTIDAAGTVVRKADLPTSRVVPVSVETTIQSDGNLSAVIPGLTTELDRGVLRDATDTH